MQGRLHGREPTPVRRHEFRCVLRAAHARPTNDERTNARRDGSLWIVPVTVSRRGISRAPSVAAPFEEFFDFDLEVGLE
jgi:hypothetical protein